MITETMRACGTRNLRQEKVSATMRCGRCPPEDADAATEYFMITKQKRVPGTLFLRDHGRR